MINHNSKKRASATADMSKFKIKSFGDRGFSTHFKHDRAQSLAPTQLQHSLTEVYEAKIRRLLEENYHLRMQQNNNNSNNLY